MLDYFVLCVMAVLAGAINAIAGGGTLLTFPALVSVLGSSPDMQVIANATNTVALCPGSATGAWGYRRELEQSRRWAVWLLPPSIVGGLVGSLLLAWLPAETFAVLVPWLIFERDLDFFAAAADCAVDRDRPAARVAVGMAGGGRNGVSVLCGGLWGVFRSGNRYFDAQRAWP